MRRTSQGTAFSSVMGNTAMQCGQVDRSTIHQAAQLDRPSYDALRMLFQQPFAPHGSDQHRHAVATVVAQFATPLASQKASEIVQEVMHTFRSELARQNCDLEQMIDNIGRELDRYHDTSKDVQKSAMDFYDEQYPMASERLRVIDKFMDDKEWMAKTLNRKARWTRVVQNAHDEVARIHELWPEGIHRTQVIRDKQQERRDAESELQSIEDTMI